MPDAETKPKPPPQDERVTRAHIYVRLQVLGTPAQLAPIQDAMQALGVSVAAVGGELLHGSFTIEETPTVAPQRKQENFAGVR